MEDFSVAATGHIEEKAVNRPKSESDVVGTQSKYKIFKIKVKMTKEKENIHSFVRVRPINQTEIDGEELQVLEYGNNTCNLMSSMYPKRNNKQFVFDHVFTPDTSQEEVYKTVVEPIIPEVLAGYNCTVLAYGQSGSGKTYTMVGKDIDSPTFKNVHAGLIPRTFGQLFAQLEQIDFEYEVSISYVELYNEVLYDLIPATEEMLPIKLFDDPVRKSGVIMSGNNVVNVKNADEVHRLFRLGNTRKQVAATSLNIESRLFHDPVKKKSGVVMSGNNVVDVKNDDEEPKLFRLGNIQKHVATTTFNIKSSRSHTVFTIRVDLTDKSNKLIKRTGKLYLVDLAGSENCNKKIMESKKAAEKQYLETAKINCSLLTLGRCIQALTREDQHIPYRESKLTRILRDSLGGTSKTRLIATVSPTSSTSEETLNTLWYAFQAKTISNEPVVNDEYVSFEFFKAKLNQMEGYITCFNNEYYKVLNSDSTTHADLSFLIRNITKIKEKLGALAADIELNKELAIKGRKSDDSSEFKRMFAKLHNLNKEMIKLEKNLQQRLQDQQSDDEEKAYKEDPSIFRAFKENYTAMSDKIKSVIQKTLKETREVISFQRKSLLELHDINETWLEEISNTCNTLIKNQIKIINEYSVECTDICKASEENRKYFEIKEGFNEIWSTQKEFLNDLTYKIDKLRDLKFTSLAIQLKKSEITEILMQELETHEKHLTAHINKIIVMLNILTDYVDHQNMTSPADQTSIFYDNMQVLLEKINQEIITAKKKNTEDQSTVQEIVEVVKSKFQHVKEDINHSFQEFQTELKQSEEKTTKHRHELMKEDIHNKEMSDLLNDVSTSCTAAQGKLELSLQRELPSCDDYRIRCDALKQLLENLQKKQSEVLGASAQQQLENVNVHGRKHLDNLNSMMNDLKIGFQKCPTNQGIMVVDLIQNFKQFTEDHILNKEGDTLHNDEEK